MNSLEALNKLQEGNLRFSSGHISIDTLLTHAKRTELLEGQKPFAVILGCSDSRVPVEIIFDQGLGSLFVIRIAGNIVAPSLIGSVEFAVSQFGTSLVVVMGHSQCGAVSATIDELHRPSEQQSMNIKAIVDRIRPTIQPFRDTDIWNKPDELLKIAVRANVSASANQLRHGSGLLEKMVDEEKLLIVGAEYSLDTGKVDFFDGVASTQPSSNVQSA